MKRWVRLLCMLAAGALLAACTTGGGSDRVVVGSGNFTEGLILGHMYADALEHAGIQVDRSKIGVGPREIYFPALERGELDLVPDYLGSTYDHLAANQTGPITEVGELRAALAALLPDGIVLLESSPAQDQDALAVTEETARRLGLRTVSDLAPVAATLVAGGPAEEETRRTGLRGLKDVYGIVFKEFVVTDALGPVTLEALRTGRIDVARVGTTAGFLSTEHLVVLAEDRPLIQPENVTPLVRAEVRTPAMDQALDAVSAALTTEELAELNKRVEIDKEDPADVAHDFLVRKGLLNA
jgi:osmoprotectant transport system substrate-binding protein